MKIKADDVSYDDFTTKDYDHAKFFFEKTDQGPKLKILEKFKKEIVDVAKSKQDSFIYIENTTSKAKKAQLRPLVLDRMKERAEDAYSADFKKVDAETIAGTLFDVIVIIITMTCIHKFKVFLRKFVF